MPGLAREIVDRSEREMSHRHEMEQRILTERTMDRKRVHREHFFGQIFGFISLLLLIGAGVYTIERDQPAVAGVIFGTTIVGIVTAFVVDKKAKRVGTKGALGSKKKESE